jgi:hypothetical protein
MYKRRNHKRRNQHQAVKLSWHDKNELLNNFPLMELSYEKLIHKKVQFNSKEITHIYLSIPKGCKYFAWFKKYKTQNICFIMKIGKNRKSINNIYIYNCCFKNELCAGKGTILYGTLFNIRENNFFNIEDVHYFKGENISKDTQVYKIRYMRNLFDYIKQVMYTKNDIIFGLPIIKYSYTEILKEVSNVPYQIYSIQNRHLYSNGPFYNEKIVIDKKIYATFLIKPTIMTDIYKLYLCNNVDNNNVDDDENYIEYKYAYIPDIKTSVMMNSIFRNIRENDNIDYIEESENEDEFEDISLDKYVDLKKKCKMLCLYTKKYDSWIPMKVSDEEVYHKNNIIN